MKRIKGLSLLLISSLLVSGCSMQEHTLEYDEDTIVEVNKELDTCELIKSVDGVEITQSMREKGRIILDGGVLECQNLKSNKLGVQEITYTYDNQVFKHIVEIVDTEAPLIVVQDEYEVDVGNEYFDLDNRVVFSDNYDTDYYKEIIGDFDINTAGEYTLIAKAEDNSGNKNEKEFKVLVIEPEKPDPEVQVVEKPVYIPSGPSSSGSQTVEEPPSNNDSEQESNNQGGGQSGGGTQNSDTRPSGPFINGVKDITVAQGTSINDLIYMLGTGISASSSITIDYSNVNTSVPGSYAVFYYGSDGASASCTVNVSG